MPFPQVSQARYGHVGCDDIWHGVCSLMCTQVWGRERERERERERTGLSLSLSPDPVCKCWQLK